MPYALTTVHARISEDSPRDRRGVAILEDLLGPAATRIEGRDGPYERTHWRDDLEASREVLKQAADAVRGAAVPLTVATDCSIALGTLPAIDPQASVLWLDAHADFDSPATQTYDFLGCMSLAGACGTWDSGLGAIDARRVVHVGARAQPGDFDHAGQEHGREELRAMLPARASEAEILSALPPGPVYVHFDPDCLDPSENPVPYGRPGGMTSAQVCALAAAVRATHDIAGVEVAAFHCDDEPATATAVAQVILRFLDAALR